MFQAGLGDEASPTSVADYEALEDETRERLPHGHAAGRKLLGKLGFRGNGIPRLEGTCQDLVPEELLKAVIDWDEDVLGAHGFSAKGVARVFVNTSICQAKS
jgi:hypothetical protein